MVLLARTLPACASSKPFTGWRLMQRLSSTSCPLASPHQRASGVVSSSTAATSTLHSSTNAHDEQRRATHRYASTSSSFASGKARPMVLGAPSSWPRHGAAASGVRRQYAAVPGAAATAAGGGSTRQGDKGAAAGAAAAAAAKGAAPAAAPAAGAAAAAAAAAAGGSGSEPEDDWDLPPKERAAAAGGAVPLPPPSNVRVKTAEFIKSSVNLEQCPKPSYPEFAVIGRSNVGKSSLINMLTGRKALAMVSKTPGKTQCINHFLINQSWYLVDLPGYGYAKRSKEKVLEWNRFTRDYFLNRETLAAVLLLVDASVPPQEIDLQCAAWLGDSEVPFTLVFTKIDKRKKRAPPPGDNIDAFQRLLLEEWDGLPPVLATSSASGQGKPELLQHISQVRQLFNRAHHNGL